MRKLLVASIAVSMSVPLGFAQRNPEQMPPVLRQALRKASAAKFSGTRTVEVMEGARRERYVEYVLRDGQRSRTWFPSGSSFAGQVIVETPRERRHYYPGKNEIYVGPPRREEAMARLVNLARSTGVRFKTQDGGKVAERPTVEITISEGQGNPLQRIWIDREHGVILKRELFDRVGTRVGFFEFSEISFAPRIVPSDFQLERRGATIITPKDELRRLVRESKMSLIHLPDSEGYRLDWVRRLPANRVPVLQQVYTKGEFSVSLFQAAAEINLPMANRTPEGFQAFSWNHQGQAFALIGNVSGDELRRLARLLNQR